MSFGRFRNFIENRCQNGSQNDSKIEPWAQKGRHFEILGALFGAWFFDEFSSSSGPKIRKMGPRSSKRQSFRRPGGMSRAAGGSFGGVMNCKLLVKFRNGQKVLGKKLAVNLPELQTVSSTPCSPAGSGWRIAYAHSAEPRFRERGAWGEKEEEE